MKYTIEQLRNAPQLNEHQERHYKNAIDIARIRKYQADIRKPVEIISESVNREYHEHNSNDAPSSEYWNEFMYGCETRIKHELDHSRAKPEIYDMPLSQWV